MRYPGEARIVGPVAAGLVDRTTVVAAWANIDGSASAVLTDSYNVSSLTDNGVGDWTLNFLQPMNDANYAIAQQSKAQGTFLADSILVNSTDGATTTSVRLTSADTNEGVVDTAAFNSIIIVGNR